MAQRLSKSFTATGVSAAIGFTKGDRHVLVVSGTFVGSVQLERSSNGNTWQTVGLVRSAAGTFTAEAGLTGQYRVRCTAYTSGTIVCSFGVQLLGTITTFIPSGCVAKAGATAGWVVRAGDDVASSTCPASQTAATLVLVVTGLKAGQTITGFSVAGQITSAGNAATLDAQLRKGTAAAGSVTDAQVGAMTQLAVTASTLVDASNAVLTNLNELVVDGAQYYILITATTAASTSMAVIGVSVTVAEAQ